MSPLHSPSKEGLISLVAKATFTERRHGDGDAERRERLLGRGKEIRQCRIKDQYEYWEVGRHGGEGSGGVWLGENAVELVRRYLYTPECPMNQDS